MEFKEKVAYSVVTVGKDNNNSSVPLGTTTGFSIFRLNVNVILLLLVCHVTCTWLYTQTLTQ